MTSYIVIGAGIGAESFLYQLAQTKNIPNKVIQLSNEAFYPSCSLRTTAIVAGRGISEGHSELGDILSKSYERFQRHVSLDRPEGVFLSPQWTGTKEKIEAFQKRYAGGEITQNISSLDLKLSEEMYLQNEPCFIIDPDLYLQWLRSEADKKMTITRETDEVIEIVQKSQTWLVKTHSGKMYEADCLFMGMGSYHRFWKTVLPNDSLIQTSNPVQGSYLVYQNINLGEKPYSLTLEGDNLIYHAHTKKLIIGSTTVQASHFLPDISELKNIDQRLRTLLPQMSWPAFETADIKTGLREKARQRKPYLEKRQNLIVSGGYYKNGYSVAIYLAEKALE